MTLKKDIIGKLSVMRSVAESGPAYTEGLTWSSDSELRDIQDCLYYNYWVSSQELVDAKAKMDLNRKKTQERKKTLERQKQVEKKDTLQKEEETKLLKQAQTSSVIERPPEIYFNLNENFLPPEFYLNLQNEDQSLLTVQILGLKLANNTKFNSFFSQLI